MQSLMWYSKYIFNYQKKKSAKEQKSRRMSCIRLISEMQKWLLYKCYPMWPVNIIFHLIWLIWDPFSSTLSTYILGDGTNDSIQGEVTNNSILGEVTNDSILREVTNDSIIGEVTKDSILGEVTNDNMSLEKLRIIAS